MRRMVHSLYMTSHARPLVLLILDGFGISTEEKGNPVAEASTPTLDDLARSFPFTTLQASGTAVGLPWGEAGNSEVGHLTIGAGRVIYHHLPRIVNAIYDGSFFYNSRFLGAAEHVRTHGGRLHLAGLVSSGSVHSYIDHLYGLIEFSRREKIGAVYLHVFTDGKDASPTEALKFIPMLEARLHARLPQARVVSLIGRFYAMDRDEQWDRIRAAYELMAEGKGSAALSAREYLASSYERGVTDEFIEPALIGGDAGVVRDGDAIIFFNFREDSMRELTRVFTDASFDHFGRRFLQNLFVVTMTEYAKDARDYAAFPPLEIRHSLGGILSDAGLRQLRIAETEKYAHVTYFFSSSGEVPFPGEERVLIPSIQTRHVDENPQMRAQEIAQTVRERLDEFDVIVANLANADMVGHAGNFAAAVRAVEALDEAVGIVRDAVLLAGGVMIVTADHGNIERKRSAMTGERITEHSLGPVPFFLVGNEFRLKAPRSDAEVAETKKRVGGILTDVAPTILELLGLSKPPEMTGVSLLPVIVEK